MKKTIQLVRSQKDHPSTRQLASVTLFDRRLDPVETALLKEWLHGNEDQLCSDASAHLVKESQYAERVIEARQTSASSNRRNSSQAASQRINSSLNGRNRPGRESAESQSFYTNHPAITFEGMCFQFSGTLEFGKRVDAIMATVKLGGYTPSGDSLTTLVNYLVVGNLEKAAHRRNGHGGKIRKAMNLISEMHCDIQIIRERDFVYAVVKAFRKFETTRKPFSGTKFTYRALLGRASGCQY
ncbi:MAG TPA: hypothetical protein VGR15_07155 [Bacteroidota bacterium]|nr:hypothetical protein [Bacteroidota bacterium]